MGFSSRARTLCDRSYQRAGESPAEGHVILFGEARGATPADRFQFTANLVRTSVTSCGTQPWAYEMASKWLRLDRGRKRAVCTPNECEIHVREYVTAWPLSAGTIPVVLTISRGTLGTLNRQPFSPFHVEAPNCDHMTESLLYFSFSAMAADRCSPIGTRY